MVTKKNNKKSTKKSVKQPDILMDCTSCETATDLLNAYIDAKIRAGKPITMDEAEIIENRHPAIECVTYVKFECVEKPLPWYKRFWNWICRK